MKVVITGTIPGRFVYPDDKFSNFCWESWGNVWSLIDGIDCEFISHDDLIKEPSLFDEIDIFMATMDLEEVLSHAFGKCFVIMVEHELGNMGLYLHFCICVFWYSHICIYVHICIDHAKRGYRAPPICLAASVGSGYVSRKVMVRIIVERNEVDNCGPAFARSLEDYHAQHRQLNDRIRAETLTGRVF